MNETKHLGCHEHHLPALWRKSACYYMALVVLVTALGSEYFLICLSR